MIQQKNDFLAKENLTQKEKISDLEEVLKILKENLENLSNEKMALEEEIQEANKEKLELLQNEYSLLEVKYKESQREKEKLMNSWKLEKEYLGKELMIAKSQLEDNKKNNELILKTLSSSRFLFRLGIYSINFR